MDRESFNQQLNKSVSFKDYKSTRMVPIFSHLTINKKKPISNSDEILFRYPLERMTPKSIFPGKKEEVIPTTKHQANSEYAKLFENFLKDFKKLAHADSNPELWFEHFDSLLMRYTSSVPAARVGHVIPDVSLYDHMTTTAALATAIYLYHEICGTLDTKSIKNRKEEKFLLISGDFYGIQNFIFNGYGDSRKYRSKLLRGRSFAVSLMSELTADMICRRIGLPHSSVMLNAGGRFTILAPNTPQTLDVLDSVKKLVNEWLLKRTFGETCIGISSITASCGDFEKKRFAALWEKMVSAMDKAKFSKIDMNLYGGSVAMEDYLERFNSDLAPGICPLCGKRPAEKKNRLEEIHVCAMCKDHLFMGENLVKKRKIAIFAPEENFSGRKLTDPIFGQYQIIFPEDDSDVYDNSAKIFKFWQIETSSLEMNTLNKSRALNSSNKDTSKTTSLKHEFAEEILKRDMVTSKFINGYVPFYNAEDTMDYPVSDEIEEGAPKTLNHIAAGALNLTSSGNKKSGVEALGVLKADVDHLGLLMACGLEDNLYTISRLATMSRQLNNFFAVYLPFFLETDIRFNDVYTVFAGGDDLFLIGPWNRIIELAAELEKNFRQFVCENPEIHFSAGISMHKPHTPIDMLASASEEALEASKHGGRNRITLFDQTLLWSHFEELKTVEQELAQWLVQGWITQVFLYKLNHFIDMAEKERVLLNRRKTIEMADMNCTRWRSLLGYSVERNAALKVDRNEREDKVNYIRNKIAQWLDSYRGALRVPLWTLQYNRR
ncbi:CRISPR-associated protein, Csm1 family [Desulfamplus magnetovallimortis]|uniref:CRISPR system single-strand-specific deoxyribonuclease Cas10/Csm1 (subtype III-A) n=2 Tax=Desulfamplus magnetovallimortis TaxID=1246637 RepID=A0A1W1HIW6_9BACT|nr:CRISPR-associated protein, Csm1 family [Desulfamplus magnetovallimortis]